jgi:hypothetical protein
MKIEVTEIELQQLISALGAQIRGIKSMLRFDRRGELSHYNWIHTILRKEELIEKLRKYKRK